MTKPKKAKTNSSSTLQRSASRRAPARSSPPALAGESQAPPESHVTTVARCQQLYAAAHTTDAAGRIQLDAARLAQSLAEVGIGIRAEQELYSLALIAAADGNAALFEADVLAAIAKAS